MESKSKEIAWTKRSVNDLNKIYKFYIPKVGEEKAFQFIELLVDEVKIIEKGFIKIGAKYTSNKFPQIEYRKLIFSHYIIIYRVSSKKIYINKVFDTRQNPLKLKL